MAASLLPLEVGFEAADVDRSFPLLLEMGLRLSVFWAKPKPRGEWEGVVERLLVRMGLMAWLCWAGRVPIGATPMLGADVLA